MSKKKVDIINLVVILLILAVAFIVLSGCRTFNVNGDLMIKKMYGVEELKVETAITKKPDKEKPIGENASPEENLSVRLRDALKRLKAIKKQMKGSYVTGISWVYFTKIAKLVEAIDINQGKLKKPKK